MRRLLVARLGVVPYAEALALQRAAARARVRLLREFDPAAVASGELEVPDPYFGADDGFDEVLDVVERACRGLLGHVAAAAPR